MYILSGKLTLCVLEHSPTSTLRALLHVPLMEHTLLDIPPYLTIPGFYHYTWKQRPLQLPVPRIIKNDCMMLVMAIQAPPIAPDSLARPTTLRRCNVCAHSKPCSIGPFWPLRTSLISPSFDPSSILLVPGVCFWFCLESVFFSPWAESPPSLVATTTIFWVGLPSQSEHLNDKLGLSQMGSIPRPAPPPDFT